MRACMCLNMWINCMHETEWDEQVNQSMSKSVNCLQLPVFIILKKITITTTLWHQPAFFSFWDWHFNSAGSPWEGTYIFQHLMYNSKFNVWVWRVSICILKLLFWCRCCFHLNFYLMVRDGKTGWEKRGWKYHLHVCYVLRLLHHCR